MKRDDVPLRERQDHANAMTELAAIMKPFANISAAPPQVQQRAKELKAFIDAGLRKPTKEEVQKRPGNYIGNRVTTPAERPQSSPNWLQRNLPDIPGI